MPRDQTTPRETICYEAIEKSQVLPKAVSFTCMFTDLPVKTAVTDPNSISDMQVSYPKVLLDYRFASSYPFMIVPCVSSISSPSL